jgi:hypothetical protein
VLFHDFTRSSSLVHTECLQVWGARELVITSSRFTNCDGTADLAIGSIGAFGVSHALVENNWLDWRGDAYFAVGTNNATDGITFLNNSATKPILVSTCAGCTGSVQLTGNYAPFSSCVQGVTYSHNVFAGGSCSATDRNVRTLDFSDAEDFDLRLKPGANAVCRGDPVNFPRLDIYGHARRANRLPDAGAYQASLQEQPANVLRRCGVNATAAKP